ncbi:MAG TPA: Hsp70 family protein [Pirellulales bacterium]|jgi:molecular chaperone DnaK|nr:Hsp70 family protein [Pirellulales bacterium]
MSVDLRLLFEKHGSDFLEAALERLAGQGAEVARDDAQYQARVADESWRAAPMQIRILDRDQVRWDDFCRALRERVFDLGSGAVALRPDWKAAVAAVVHDWAVPHTGDPKPTPRRAWDDGSPSLPASAGGDRAVGIDLGTTYSVIAYVDAQGRPTTIANSSGEVLTPSVVLFDEGATIVGKEAVLAAAMEPDKVAECVKRDMGEKYYSKRIKGELLPPEVISSYILRRLKADAERKLGRVSKAVITVPAYFDETRRRATMDAGRLAGLEVLDIINEPTAAAIVYGYQEGFLDRSGSVAGEQPVRVLVYDLGGGTFDVTVVEMRGKSFKALATDGDVRLGGKDWDEKLIEIAAGKLQHEIGEDPRQCPETLEDMWLAVETTKKTLSERLKATMFVNHRGRRLKAEIARAEFEEATAPLVLRTHTTAEIVVMQAGLTWPDIGRVLVVGGSTRMPMIIRMLEELAGQAVNHSVSADEAVAHGAALYADMLMHERGAGTGHAQFSVTNINSHSLGVVGINPATGERLNKIIIAKNTPLPHSAAKRFRTFRPGQPNVKVTVVEGESELPDACIEVGTCVIRDLPPNLPAGWPVEVRYTYQENGRLQVAAQLIGHEGMVTTEFLRNNSLSEDDLMLWGQCLSAEATKTAVE